MAERVVVIGAGPAGCAAAFRLHKQGKQVVMLEQQPHVGGRALSLREQGRVLDTGAGFFTNFYPALERLLDELSLRDQVVTLSRSNHLVQDGVARPMTLGSVGAFARFSGAGVRAKLRMAAGTGWATLRHRSLDITDPADLAPWDDASIEEHALRTVGEEAYHALVRPGIEPFWYFSCAEVSRALFLALQSRAADAHFFTLRHGMDSVCRAVVDRLDEVHTSVDVRQVQRADDGFVVRAEQGQWSCDAVVVATTASVAAKLSADLAEVSDAQKAFLESQRYVPTVQCSYLTPVEQCPGRVSAAFPSGPGEPQVAAINFNRTKGQGEPGAYDAQDLVSVYLSASEARQQMDLDDEQLADHAWRLARAFWDAVPEQATRSSVIRHREAIPVHAVGRYRQAADFIASQRGPVVFAGDYLATATVDGAVRSGQRAADLLSA